MRLINAQTLSYGVWTRTSAENQLMGIVQLMRIIDS